MNNIADYLKIAIIGFIGVWVINKGLEVAGMSQFKA